MSQEKAQLIAPIGIMTVSGMTATGVITASSFTGNIVGSAKSLVNGTDVTAGVVTATSFVGNLTGNIQRLADSAPNINVGVTTATSFVGNLTGSVTDLTSQPAITVGLVTATSLSGPITGNVTGNVVGNVTGNVTGTIAGDVTGDVTGNATGTSGGLGINYNGGWTGAGTSQISAGVVTATTFYGDGSNLEGVSSGPVSQQSIGITSATTTIDLSNGNVIYATQSADTTVSFASTANGNVYFIRTKDDNTTARTITWPDSIQWDGGTAPTLIQVNPRSTDAQIFLLVTRDMGLTWYGKEVVKSEPQTFSLFRWGTGNQGLLGISDELARSSPVQVGPNTNWAYMTRGYTGSDANMTGGVKTDGTLWMWGSGNYGQLGTNQSGGPSQRSSPMQIGTETTWDKAVTTAAYVGAATKTDGTLWTWGSNSYSGTLGLNQSTPTSLSSPTQVPGSWGTGEYKLVGGNYNMFAIKGDGTLWSWGHQNAGQLGLNLASKVQRSSPMQVGTDTTWSKLGASTGGNGGCIKTDGTLWVWGYNEGGMLANNNTNDRSSPVQVGTETTWDHIAISTAIMMGIKTDGTLWVWGKDEWGDMGLNAQGAPAHRSSPTQLGTETTWSKLGVQTRYTSYATKTDGTAWTWGLNNSGQLGQNQAPAQLEALSSPTQIPGTSWSEVNGTFHGAAGLQMAG